MSRQVIDELVALLKLDDKQFKQAMANARRELHQTAQESKKDSESMSNDVKALALKYLSLVAIIAMLKKGFAVIGDTAAETMALANASRHLGQSAAGLRNWQNAVEILGGKAEDANASIETFQKSLFDLVAMGKVGGNLEMLARLGVRFQDSKGHARSFDEVAAETASAIQRNLQNGTFNRQEAYYAAREAGFDDATANGMIAGKLGAALSQARGIRQVSGADVAKATDIAQQHIRRSQEQQALALEAIDSPIGNAVEKLLDGFNRMLEWLMDPGRMWNKGSSDPKALAVQAAKAKAAGLPTPAEIDAARAKDPNAYKGVGYVPDNWLTRLNRSVTPGTVVPPPTPNAAAGARGSSTTTIGSITVNTRATDARGVAKDLGKEIRKQNVATADAGSR